MDTAMLGTERGVCWWHCHERSVSKVDWHTHSHMFCRLPSMEKSKSQLDCGQINWTQSLTVTVICVFCGVCLFCCHSYTWLLVSVCVLRWICILLLPLPSTATVSQLAIWRLGAAVETVFTCSRLECGWITTKNRRPLCVLSVWAVSVAVSLSMMVLRLLQNHSCWWVRVAYCSHCVQVSVRVCVSCLCMCV